MKHWLQTLRHGAHTGAKKLSRKILHWRMRNRPQAEVLLAERKLRGLEQYKKLRSADVVFVSFGKSGRTWLRVMVSHLFRIKHDLPENAILSFDNFHNMEPAVPKTFFTHDNYIKDYTGEPDSKKPFYDKPVILLVRDPRDVAVSQFFQWKFRLKDNKVALNNYPSREDDVSIFDFVMSDIGGGMLEVIQYMNVWAREVDNVERFHLVRYEDLRADSPGQLRGMLDFMGVSATDEQVAAAVEYSSFENMKKMESQAQFRLAGGRMMPRDKDNPDSYKVRRAKVGGYRDYFSDEEVALIDARLRDTLDAYFKYV
ncbi:MAG: sulfotransferase domain-containing protein [Gammaproteobacteria bacterium]|nr:sulfotransferase domain-containing protein [Gammaproteobacteria bacterium]